MIVLRHLTLARGAKTLFDSADLTLYAGQKVGVIGANGAGKSSLFALLLGELHQESGDLELPPRLAVAHVAQETSAIDRSAIDHVLDGDAELREIERKLHQAEHASDGNAVALLHEQLDHVDGYSARSRAAALLHGLGFAADAHARSVAEFSGGWRVRLNLARALMCRSDLLLLDEPTNHLDLDAVIWLEQWLVEYRGTLLLISHDRDFLDASVGQICHIDGRKLKLYRGNYSAFEKQRAANLAQQRAAFEKQQREIAHLHAFIDRFRAKATKARQAQSRMKALERMEEIAPAHVDSPFTFRFRDFGSCPDPLITLDGASAGYAGKTVLSEVKLAVRAGARIGLLGRNGAGKSTLIKLLAGALPPLEGARREGKGLRIGYFAQHQLEQLRPDESAMQHLTRLDPRTREQDFRDFLGGFNFDGDQQLAPVRPFSGGEKARLALALIIWQRPNLLLLDEPTNHLDLETRHALNLALQEYEGAVVVVSHDRHLLRTTTESWLRVAEGRVCEFEGDLEDYRAWLMREESLAEQSANPLLPVAAKDRKEQRRLDAETRNLRAARRKPLEKQIRQLELRLEQLGTERNRLDTALAAESIHTAANKTQLKEALRRHGEVNIQVGELEDAWLALHTELERLEQQPENS